MAKTIKTVQEVEDLVRGVTFFGTGGGGNPEQGLAFLKETLNDVGKIELVDADEIPDNAMVCTCFYMGSIAPHTPEVKERMKVMGLTEKQVDRILPEAVEALERFLGKKIEAIVPIELGGINTPAPIDAAARLGKKVVDGDYAGRAIPEIVQTTPSMAGKTLPPMSSVDEWGNVAFVEKVRNHQCAEALGKAISTVAFGLVGQTAFVMTGKELKQLLIRGTVSESIEVGRVIRESVETGKDPATEIAKFLNGWVLFRGTVSNKDWEDKQGYYWGTHTFSGTGEFSGKTLKIWFKNENHISWLDDKAWVTSPDIMQVIDEKTGEPICNPDLKVGDKVAVVGVKKREAFNNELGIATVGPAHYGFDVKHVPIEELLG
ncbi:MAG: DUF917 domain-containing protein [Firmicutes bacterium]|jgi:DUF917 family protein|nr:DUF917 domain-containing protein [Bacillota bacterium]